jgi:ribose 5-phosphate isomerase A
MLSQDKLKKAVAKAAIDQIPEGIVLGIGTGSTVNYLIEALSTVKNRIRGAVSSSESTTIQLKRHHIPIFDLNEIDELLLYIDGADEVNHYLHLIKGGGAALTKEKIIASVAKQFICIADESKFVDILGTFPLPVEVLPIARSYVAKELIKLGGKPALRIGTITEHGNQILDVADLIINKPVWLENKIDQINGVVTNGIFAKRHADKLLLSTQNGIIVKE